jgi:crossover junction endodeoxyribonuclease RuvC
MVVLGIDPGTANTGYGVVARHGGRLVALDGGSIKTAPGLDAGERLATIHARVGELLDEHDPDALAVEDLYFGANARSAFAVGQARGVVILAAGQRGLPCSSYTPQQVKAAVCGSGRAGKGQVQRMVQRLLALTDLPAPDHAADALAVAICHANGASLRAAVERSIGEAMLVKSCEARGRP